MVGPGNPPLTVTMGLVEHNLVVFFSTTYTYIYIYISIYVTLLAILANTNRKLISLTVTFMGMVLGSVKFGVFSQPHHSTTKFAVSSRFLSHPYIFFSLFIEPVTQQIKRIFYIPRASDFLVTSENMLILLPCH